MSYDLYHDSSTFIPAQQIEEDHSTDDLKAGESIKQIAGADVIILNKVDLAVQPKLDELEAKIRHVNPIAPIHRTIRGELDLGHILDLGAYRLPPKDTEEEHVHSDKCERDHAAPNHYEVRGISSLKVSCGVLSQRQLDALDEWLRSVLWESTLPGQSSPSLQVLRCKGAFTLESGQHYVLQGVRNMYELSELTTNGGVDVPDKGKIILIGRGLDENVRHSLEAVLS